MEVKRRAIGIALKMVSSRNVEDVVAFLKKQLQSTMDADFDKVSALKCMANAVEPRIPPTAHPIHPYLRHQILRSRGQCRLRPYGLFGRRQQPLCCGCDLFRTRSRGEVPRSAIGNHGKAHPDVRRDSVREGIQRGYVDCWGVLLWTGW
jgi:hypothetical protein